MWLVRTVERKAYLREYDVVGVGDGRASVTAHDFISVN